MKKTLLLTIILLMLTFTACMPVLVGPQENFPAQPIPAPTPPAQPTVSESTQVTSLMLPYHAGDTLNPYQVKTQTNRVLIPLLYDSLIHPDRQWRPENQLATEITATGNVYTIRWREDARFTDGSYLTGEDIVYSFQTAMTPENPWSSTLTNVASLSVQESEKTMMVGLHRPDADFPLLLSFPIIKKGSKDMEYPTGVSKFYMAGAHNTGLILSRNAIYYDQNCEVDTVKLVHAADQDSLQFYMSTGEIDMLYHDSSNQAVTINAPSKSVSKNQLVYIGINSSRGLLAKPEFRHALSLAINRAEIAMTAYTGYARAAVYPLHPDFYRLEKIDVAATRNLTAADALLDGIGLTEKNNFGQRTQYGLPITLRLLVNSDNSSRNSTATLVVEQLAAVGIKVEVVSDAFAQYQGYLQTGQFDLYIGETLIMDNMDFTQLLSGGLLGYYTAYSEELEQRIFEYRQTGDAAPLCEMFLAQSPFLPLVYRESLLYTSRDFGAEVVATQQDLFYNIMDW